MNRTYKYNTTLPTIILFSIVVSCSMKSNESSTPEISQDSVSSILRDWKLDSLGCLKKRSSIKINVVIDQLKLMNQDSSTIIKFLGTPNSKRFRGDTITVFNYSMGDCSRTFRDSSGNKITGVNFELRFDRNRLVSTDGYILD
jgi:hypothetical protein